MSTTAKEYESSYSATKFHAYSGKVKRYMNLARQAAEQSALPDYRHGAVLIKGSVRNVSTNKNGYCAFARIGKAGKYKISKPCPMCHAAMKHVGIKKVVYTIDNKVAGSYKL